MRLPAAPSPQIVREPMHADPTDGDRETAAMVIANAEPRSFRVVTVAIPAMLGRVETVHYEVMSTGSASILGSRVGVLDGATAASGIVLTVGVPAAAIAGRIRVGTVRFSARGIAGVRVPLELDVAGTSRIEVTPKRPMRGARRGDRVELTFSIRNTGNVRDTIDLLVDAPPTWSARFAEPPRLVLEPGEWIERTIYASVPVTSDLGDFGVGIIAVSRSGVRARGVATVEISDELRSGADKGAVLTMGIGSAGSPGGSARAVESFGLEGSLSDAMTVAGRVTTSLPSDLVTSRALSMLGYSPRSSFLSIGAPGWSATAGNTGVALSDLGGQAVFGRGGSLVVRGGVADVRLLAAAPTFSNQLSWDQSSLIAASADTKFGTSTVTAFLTHLRDSSYTVRALDAAGLGLELRPWTDGIVSGQVAARSYGAGSGVGAAAMVRGPLAGGQVDLRLTHAPGGSNAFAVASDVLTLAGDRSFGRLHAEASYWATRDESMSSNDLGSMGWSLAPAYPVLPSFTLGAYVQGSSFASSGDEGRYSSTQNDFGGRGVVLLAGFELSADSRLSNISRAIEGASPVSVNDDSRRVTNRVRLDHAGARGEVGIGGSMETSIVGYATMPSQTTLDAHVDRLQVLPRFPHFTLSGSAQRLRFGDAMLTTSRAEAVLDLHRSTRIALGIERGTARDEAGVLQTVLTLKFERAAYLPALGRRSERGVVFEDRNANGVRDPGEPGVSGIVVRRGSQSVSSDGDGVFRLDAAGSGRIEIDPRSLPSGWLPSPRSITGVADEHSLGVVPTAALDVSLRIAGANEGGDGSAAVIRIGVAALTLRDTAGRAWTARTDASSRATFDALPVGRYTLVAELEESSEPLLVDPIAAIDLTSGSRRQRVTVTVRTRPLRIFRGQP